MAFYNLNTIEGRFRHIIREKFRTSKQASEQLGVSHGQINYYINHPNSNATLDVVRRLGYDLDWYLGNNSIDLYPKKEQEGVDVEESFKLIVRNFDNLKISQLLELKKLILDKSKELSIQ